MLDAGDAAAEGVEDARIALGVGGDRYAAVPPRLVHDGPDLLLEEALVVGVVVGAAHASGGADLHHVGALAQHAPYGEPGRVGGVGDLRHAGAEIGPVGQPYVGVAPGVADDPHRGMHPRAHDPAGLDGRTVARGQAGQIADAGDTGGQCLRQSFGGVQGDQDGIEFRPAAGSRALRVRQVDMAVEETGQDRTATGVEGQVRVGVDGRGRSRGGGPRVGDGPLGIDGDDGVVHGGRSGAVDEAGVVDAQRGLRGRSRHGGRITPPASGSGEGSVECARKRRVTVQLSRRIACTSAEMRR